MGAMKIWMLCLVWMCFPCRSPQWNTFYSLLFSPHLFELEIFLRPVCSFSLTKREFRSSYWARNKGSEFCSLNIFLYFFVSIFYVLIYLIVCNCFFILTICRSRWQKGNPNPVIGREMQHILMIYLLTIFAGVVVVGWGIHYLSYCPHGFGQGCAWLAVWAGRPPSRDRHASLVQLWR